MSVCRYSSMRKSESVSEDLSFRGTLTIQHTHTHIRLQNVTYSVYKFHSALEILAGSARMWVKADQFAAFRVILFVLSRWLTIKTELKPK